MSNQSLGATLRAAREAQGLNQKQLSVLLNTAKSQVLRWENDEVVPSPRALASLAQQLELRPSMLFALAGASIPDDLATLPAMLRADYDLPPEAIADIESYIAQVAGRYTTTKSTRSSKPRTGRRET